jgi:hypothetical protein
VLCNSRLKCLVVRKYSIRLLINVMPMASQRGKSEGRQVVPVTVVVGSAVIVFAPRA